MKKVILPLAAALVLFASCKKDYTCTCTTVETQTPSGEPSTTSTSTTTTVFKDQKKSVVADKYECYSNEYSYTYDDWFTGEPTQVTIKNTCEISK
jgi:uncharacterized lipoprotein YajG